MWTREQDLNPAQTHLGLFIPLPFHIYTQLNRWHLQLRQIVNLSWRCQYRLMCAIDSVGCVWIVQGLSWVRIMDFPVDAVHRWHFQLWQLATQTHVCIFSAVILAVCACCSFCLSIFSITQSFCLIVFSHNLPLSPSNGIVWNADVPCHIYPLVCVVYAWHLQV